MYSNARLAHNHHSNVRHPQETKSITEKFENTHDRAKQREQLQLLRDKLKQSQQELMYHEITGLDSFGEMMKSFEITYTAKKGQV